MDLSNRVAVVTGSSSGIGLASAELFRKEGAVVVGVARHATPEARAAVGPQGRFIEADVSATGALPSLFAEVERSLGKIDVLLVNAAVVKLAPLSETTPELFDEVVATNLRGAFFTLRAAIPHLKDGASVIFTTSYLNRIGFPGASVVSMTKAGLRALVRVAAAELGSRSIRVNALCPGAIATPLWSKLGLPADVLESAGAEITRQIPLGRWGSAAEVARAALFLASASSAYVNGIELGIDGGLRQV